MTDAKREVQRLEKELESLEAEVASWEDSKSHLIRPCELIEVKLTDLLLAVTDAAEGTEGCGAAEAEAQQVVVARAVASDIRRVGERVKRAKARAMAS